MKPTNTSQIIHKTARGKQVDMNRLMTQNELAVAVGNVRVNARGDELGPGGNIIRKREDIMKETKGYVPAELHRVAPQETAIAQPKPAPVVAPKPAPIVVPTVEPVKETSQKKSNPPEGTV